MTRCHSPLGSFLLERRNTCTPQSVGLPVDPRRRVSGLRRAEVAELSGISVEYYMRLEQGRVTTPSAQVVEALARTLHLDPVQTEYAHRLARGATLAPRPIPAQTTESLRILLDQWSASPAYVTDSNLDVLAANDVMIALTDGGLAPGANALMQTFHPQSRRTVRDWENVARDAIAALRFNADPRSPRLRELVDHLSRDADFARMWALHEVAQPSTFRLSVHNDALGDLEIGVQNFTPPALPGCVLTVYFATPGSAAALAFDRLAGALGLAA